MTTLDFVKRKKDMEEFETCILCGSLTSVGKDLPINLRKNFLYGQGQLCDKCAKK